jgi:lysophospholipase L1-like esterase
MKRALARLGLVVGALLLVAVLFEAVFRLLDLRGFHENRTRNWDHALLPKHQGIADLSLQFKPNSRFYLRYDSNPRGYFDAAGGLTYQINEHGFRGSGFPTQKPEGGLRLMLLGDSFTFGEGVRLEDTFAVQLQGQLREERPELEVLNLGVSSWNTQDEYIYLNRLGHKFEPDLVVVVFVLNDAAYSGGLDLWEDFRKRYEAIGLLKRSYLASYVYSAVAREISGRRYVESLVGSALDEPTLWKIGLGMLSRMDGISQKLGARFAVVIFPFMYQLDHRYPFAPLHELVRKHCESEGIPVLDLLEAFRGQDYLDLWVHPSDQHPNEIGHAIAARAMADFVQSKHLLDPRPPTQ